MRVLIVRLSSMGDVVHTLPALTDAARAIPTIHFDWAVDESFADIPAWHPHVGKVFPVALRRWRAGLSSAAGRGEAKEALRELRTESYDAIVDLQGEFKSAFIARLANGKRYGYDGASAREWGAQTVYREKFGIAKGTHSMSRMRRLLSQALGYSYDEAAVDYGIDRNRLPVSPLTIDRPYVVFIHSTSWASKNWPEQYWRELAASVTAGGYAVVLPWGSEAERERSVRIAAEQPNRIALPNLSISAKASIINRAAATVGLDTGLSHIAAALGIPSITLYGATDPNLCGAIGENQIHIRSDFECVGCHETDCSFTKNRFKPACFESLTPATVFPQLEQLLGTPVKSDRIYQTA
jgi:lipopolysaccharide heptosyltransferase I